MRVLGSLLMALTLITSTVYISIQSPQLEDIYLRYRVGRNVVKVVKTGSLGRVMGGGTGFAIRGDSGTDYIMTNAHVCDMYKGGKTATIEEQDGTLLDREIVSISDSTDLCLIKADESLTPLEIASYDYIGEKLAIVGHPELMPLNISWGEILGQGPLDVMLGVIGQNMTKEECSKPKNRIEAYDTGVYGMLDTCLEEINAYQTTAVAMPGNSGSPVVNVYGHLSGVLFAGDSKVYWGNVVTLEDIKDF